MDSPSPSDYADITRMKDRRIRHLEQDLALCQRNLSLALTRVSVLEKTIVSATVKAATGVNIPTPGFVPKPGSAPKIKLPASSSTSETSTQMKKTVEKGSHVFFGTSQRPDASLGPQKEMTFKSSSSGSSRSRQPSPKAAVHRHRSRSRSRSPLAPRHGKDGKAVRHLSPTQPKTPAKKAPRNSAPSSSPSPSPPSSPKAGHSGSVRHCIACGSTPSPSNENRH